MKKRKSSYSVRFQIPVKFEIGLPPVYQGLANPVTTHNHLKTTHCYRPARSAQPNPAYNISLPTDEKRPAPIIRTLDTVK
jgi:hypothetical protein